MNEDDIRNIDEASTAIVRVVPSMLWNFREELIAQGFNEHDSLELTKKYLGVALGGHKDS